MQAMQNYRSPMQLLSIICANIFQGEEHMIYLLLLYMDLCHYTGGETSS